MGLLKVHRLLGLGSVSVFVYTFLKGSSIDFIRFLKNVHDPNCYIFILIDLWLNGFIDQDVRHEDISDQSHP